MKNDKCQIMSNDQWKMIRPMENDSSHSSLELVLVLVFVIVLFFDDIQLNGIETHDFQTSPAFVARNDIALVCVQINMDISITFRASSCRHLLYLRK